MRVLSVFLAVATLCLSAVSAVVLADRVPGSTPCLAYFEETPNVGSGVFRQRIVPSNETIELRSTMPETTHVPLNDTAYLTFTAASAPQATTYYLHRNQAAAPIALFTTNRFPRGAELSLTTDGKFGLLMLAFPGSGRSLVPRLVGFRTDGTEIHLIPETVRYAGVDYTLSNMVLNSPNAPHPGVYRRYMLLSATPITSGQPQQPTPYFVIYDLETFSLSRLYEFSRADQIVVAWSPQETYLAAALNNPRRIALLEPSRGEIASYPLDDQVTSTALYWANSGKALAIGYGEGRDQRLLGVLWADGRTLAIHQTIQSIIGWSQDEQSLGVMLTAPSGNPLWQRIDLNTGALHQIGDGGLMPQRLDRRIRNLQRSQGYIWVQQWHSASSYDLILMDPAGEREAYRIEARAMSRSHLVEMIDPPAPITALIWHNQSLTLINTERGQIVGRLEGIHAFQEIHAVDGYIAFAAWRDGQQWIGIADPVRGVLKLVAPYTGPGYGEINSAQFSPDLTQAAVHFRQQWHGEIRRLSQIVSADGKLWTLHAGGMLPEEYPSVIWSPDMRHVLITWRDSGKLPNTAVYQRYRYYNTATRALEGEMHLPVTANLSRLLDGGWSDCFYHYTPEDYNRWSQQH